MDAQHWLDELRRELARRRLPPHYSRRLISELSDHLNDFMEDRQSMDAKDLRDAVGELGAPSQIAASAAAEFRKQHFSGRHPLLAFVAFPIVLLPLLWIAFFLGLFGLAFAANGLGLFVPAPNAAEWIGRALVYVGVLAPIFLAAVLVCRSANKAALSWKWSMLACGVLAIVTTRVFPGESMKTPDRPGMTMLFIIPPVSVEYFLKDLHSGPHVPRSAHRWQVVEFAIPWIICVWAIWRQSTNRRYSPAS